MRGKISFGPGSEKPGGIRPRVPAMVKREVADSREEEAGTGEDTKRMQYRGFDKSKLNASRKQQRKEARQGKKKNRAEHQVCARLNPASCEHAAIFSDKCFVLKVSEGRVQ